MVTLTLARYILEYSLMDYSTIQLSDTKMACAALFMSLRMNKCEGWNEVLEYYSGMLNFCVDLFLILRIISTILCSKNLTVILVFKYFFDRKYFFKFFLTVIFQKKSFSINTCCNLSALTSVMNNLTYNNYDPY